MFVVHIKHCDHIVGKKKVAITLKGKGKGVRTALRGLHLSRVSDVVQSFQR